VFYFYQRTEYEAEINHLKSFGEEFVTQMKIYMYTNDMLVQKYRIKNSDVGKY